MEQVAAQSASFADLTVREFITELASAKPVPGGGSASAIAAGLAAGLVVMVAVLSRDRPRYEAFAGTIAHAEARGLELVASCLELADVDAAAYGAFAAALKQPRATGPEAAARAEAISKAARTASDVPLDLLGRAAEIAELAASLAGRSSQNAASDLLVATGLAEASAGGAAANVRVNLPAVQDEVYARSTMEAVERRLAGVEQHAAEVRRVVAGGGLRTPEVEPRSRTGIGR